MRQLWSSAGLWSSDEEKGNWADRLRAAIHLRRAGPTTRPSCPSRWKLTYARFPLRYRVVGERDAWEREKHSAGPVAGRAVGAEGHPAQQGPALDAGDPPHFTLVDAADREAAEELLPRLRDVVHARGPARGRQAEGGRRGQDPVRVPVGGGPRRGAGAAWAARRPPWAAEWEKVRKWLEGRPSQMWRVVAGVLRNLIRRPPPTAPRSMPGRSDPVTELARFLSVDRFTGSAEGAGLTIPARRSEVEPNANENLTITRTRGGQDSVYRYKLTDKSNPESTMVFRYEPATRNDRAFDYIAGRPDPDPSAVDGQGAAELGEQSHVAYAIERLWKLASPRGGGREQQAEVAAGQGVTLRPEPEDSVPQVPDLLPTVPGS